MTDLQRLLLSEGYALFDDGRVWGRPDFAGIAYSDGDASEDGLLSTLRGARDVSVFSRELKAACVDWPSIYHLSSERSNLLRPFSGSFCAKTRVLEIGAGCGAVTRFLGESGAQVLALEGSRRRAMIARERTRDLGNVELLAERFQDFKPASRFDVITLIGVLEYASVFSEAAQPALDMLRKVRAMLAPGGKLFLAIENRFGLKYLAGVPEDHVGKAMVGIEGRYLSGGVRTWGRFELDQLVAVAGFGRRDFYLPMPDYKMPVSIIGPEGIKAHQDEFDAGTLAAQAVRRDLQVGATTFNLQRTWAGVAENRLLIELGNSFLIQAEEVGGEALDEGVLAWHYSTQRARAFARESWFVRDIEGRMFVRSRALCNEVALDRGVRMCVAEQEDYHRGQLFVEEFRALLTQCDWGIDSLVEITARYVQLLRRLLKEEGFELAADDLDQVLPDHYIDATPFNMMSTNDGRVVYFDREWEVSSPTLGWLILRSLLFTYAGTAVAPMRAVAGVLQVGDLIREVLSRLYSRVGVDWLEIQLQREVEFQSSVNDVDQRGNVQNLLGAELPAPHQDGQQLAGANGLAQQLDLVSQSLHASVALTGERTESVLEQQDLVSQSLHACVAQLDDRIGAVLDQQDAISQSLHAGVGQVGDRVDAALVQQDAISQSLHAILHDFGTHLERSNEHAVAGTTSLRASMELVVVDVCALRAANEVLGVRVDGVLEQLDAVSQSLHAVAQGMVAGLQGVHADVALSNVRADGMLKQLDAVSQSLHSITGTLVGNVQAIASDVGAVSRRQEVADSQAEASLRILENLKARADRAPLRRFVEWLRRLPRK